MIKNQASVELLITTANMKACSNVGVDGLVQINAFIWLENKQKISIIVWIKLPYFHWDISILVLFYEAHMRNTISEIFYK